MSWIGDTGYWAPKFDNFNAPYGSMSYMGSGASSSSSTESTNSSSGDVRDIEKKKKSELNEYYKERVAQGNLSTVFKGITKKEEKKIFEYATDKMEYHEKLGTSLAMGAGLGIVLPNVGRISQPFSMLKSAFGSSNNSSWTNFCFKDVVKTDLWKKHPMVLQSAYAELNKAEIRYNKWKSQSLFKRGYTNAEFSKMFDTMEKALKSDNVEEILKATSALSNANKVKRGLLLNRLTYLKDRFWGRKPSYSSPHVMGALRDNEAIEAGAKVLANATDSTFKGCLKSSVGGKIGIVFAATSILGELRYIKAAFKKGEDGDGIKQLGQSVAKAFSSWGGYTIGEALGKWGGAKLGAAIGTAICPALGTFIGYASGFVMGTVASWGLRKITNKAVGDNIANPLLAKEEIDNLKCKNKNNKELVAQKESEQQQYLSNLLAQAQKDKNIDKSTMDALTKAAQAYAPLEQNPNLEQVA